MPAYGIQSPKVAARTSPVIHWRCDSCPKVLVRDRLEPRPANWIDVRFFSRVGSVLVRMCSECSQSLTAGMVCHDREQTDAVNAMFESPESGPRKKITCGRSDCDVCPKPKRKANRKAKKK